MPSSAPLRLDAARFTFPTPRFPAYAVVIQLKVEHRAEGFKVTAIEVDGKQSRDILLLQGEREIQDRTLREGSLQLLGRADWRSGSRHEVRVLGQSPSGDQWQSETVTVQAPPYGGYWDPTWPYYASFTVSERAGQARSRELVMGTLALYHDRIKDPGQVRVVGIDPHTGQPCETPSQVIRFDVWNQPDLVSREPYRYQPTATCQIAFLADVPAHTDKVYLVFYGKDGATVPQYETDLRVVSRSDGRIAEVENSFYKVVLHEKSGLINAVHIKQGVDVTLSHGLEPPGTVHWNPDCYAPPKPWSHISDWNPPAHSEALVGNVAALVSNWGPMPFGVDEVEAAITYTFSAYSPVILASTMMRVVKPVSVQALRMGEMVFNKDVLDHFAWRDEQGEIHSFNIHEVRQHPLPAVFLPAKTPWVALYAPGTGCGVAGLTLDFVADRFGSGGPLTEQPHMYVEIGPWVYWCRSLINTFVSNNPTRLINVPEGSLFAERNAYVPFAFEPTGSGAQVPLERIEERYRALTQPLLVKATMDTDPRVPDKWVPPVLAEPFEELPPDQVFRPE